MNRQHWMSVALDRDGFPSDTVFGTRRLAGEPDAYEATLYTRHANVHTRVVIHRRDVMRHFTSERGVQRAIERMLLHLRQRHARNLHVARGGYA